MHLQEVKYLDLARIRDRTYAYLRLGSKIQFKIDRHLGAFRDESIGGLVQTQTWEFDFDKLTLTYLKESDSYSSITPT